MSTWHGHHWQHWQQLLHQLLEGFDGMLSAKVVTLSGAATVAVVAALQKMEPPARPEGFWPVTGSGWISLILSVGGAVTMAYGLWRFSQKGLLAEIRKVKGELAKIREAATQHAREERAHTDEVVRELRREHREAMEEQEERLDGQGLILNGLVTGLAESRLDRAHITEGLRLQREQLARMEEAREKRDEAQRERDLAILRAIGDLARRTPGGAR